MYRVCLKRRSFDNYCNPTPLTRSDNEIDTFLTSAAIGATTAASAKAGHRRVTRRSSLRNQVARHGSLFCACATYAIEPDSHKNCTGLFLCTPWRLCKPRAQSNQSLLVWRNTTWPCQGDKRNARTDRAAFYGSVRRANCVNNNLNARVATTKDEQSRCCRGCHSATNRRRSGQVLSMNNMLWDRCYARGVILVVWK